MKRVLIIDDEPDARDYLKELAPADWEWIEAEDVQSGVTAFLQSWRTLDLVVVDIHLPDDSGHVICSCIRKVSEDLPILPFSAMYQELPAIDEFGCLPPLRKPVQPEDGRRRLAALGQQPVQQSGMSALARWIAEHSARMLPKAGTVLERQRQRVVVFATSSMVRRGLAEAFKAQALVSEAYDDLSLRGALTGRSITALVAVAADYDAVCDWAQEYRVPLVLLADRPEQIQVLSSPEIAAVLLGSDPAIAQRLREVVRALAAGEPLEPILALQETAALLNKVVSPAIQQRLLGMGLSQREIEVVWLLSRGMSRQEIAQYLDRDETTIKSHVQHVQSKLGLDKPGFEAWVRDEISRNQRETM